MQNLPATVQKKKRCNFVSISQEVKNISEFHKELQQALGEN